MTEGQDTFDLLRKFHVINGKNKRDDIMNEEGPNSLIILCIPSILKGSPTEAGSMYVPTICTCNSNLEIRIAGSFHCPNRPFYRYGRHIELIRFKEYYRMPRGNEHISFVFSSAFRDIFS